MISAIGRTDAMGVPRAVFLLGVNQDDLLQLAGGEEIVIEMGELGLPPLQLRVVAGKDDDAIWEQLPKPGDGTEVPRLTAGSQEGRRKVQEGIEEIKRDIGKISGN